MIQVLFLTQYMMGVHPSMVTHWKVVSMASMMLSKLVIPWFGPVHFSRQIDSLFLWHRQCKFLLLWDHRGQRGGDIQWSLYWNHLATTWIKVEIFPSPVLTDDSHTKSISEQQFYWFLPTFSVFVVNYWENREGHWNGVGGEWKGDGGFDSISELYISVSRNFTNSDICNYLFIGTFHSTIIELNAIYCI